MHERLAAEILHEIEQIDQLLAAYEGVLTRAQFRAPNLVELTAIASVLHSFYNGIENMLLRLGKAMGERPDSGSQWHRDLLAWAADPGPGHPTILSEESVRKLGEYLSFRHFYRHSYSMFLEWVELEKLVTPLDEVWECVKGELRTFCETKLNGRV